MDKKVDCVSFIVWTFTGFFFFFARSIFFIPVSRFWIALVLQINQDDRKVVLMRAC